MIETRLMDALIEHADKHHDGQLTILKSTNNWRVGFVPTGQEDIGGMVVGDTFERAALEALRVDMPVVIARQLISVQPIDPKPYMDLYETLRDNPDKALVFSVKVS